MDERVIAISPVLRTLLVKGIIVPRRSKYSADNYRCIWDAEAKVFPLVKHSADIADKLSNRMGCVVGLAMRYGNPCMDDTLRTLEALGIQRVQVLPLYPHYTRSSFETAVVHALDRCRSLGLGLELLPIGAYYSDKLYRRTLADSVRPYLSVDVDKLIVSMHGIPLSHLSRPCRAENGWVGRCVQRMHSPEERATCYRLHCEETVEFLREDLGLETRQIELVYQSRLGRHEWMRPYFADRVKRWAKEGAKRIAVVCPGFVCDCLETIYEIDIEYREEFLRYGGEHMTYIPCLNSSEALISVLANLINNRQNP